MFTDLFIILTRLLISLLTYLFYVLAYLLTYLLTSTLRYSCMVYIAYSFFFIGYVKHRVYI